MNKRTVAFLACLFALSYVFAAGPKRIVALSPASAEILCSIGAFDQIVARTDFCDYPEKVTEKPSVGGFDGKNLSIETIMSYNPDMVYMTRGMHDHLEKTLNQLGVKTFFSEGTSVESVIKEILDVGQLTGHRKAAEKVAANIKRAMVSENSVRVRTVYWEVWNAPYMSAGKDSFINDMIYQAGLLNIFADINQAYPMVSEESIIAKDPMVILIPASSGITVEDVKKRAGWENIFAVQNDRIFIIDDNLFTRPGPRIGQAIIELADMTYVK